MPFPASLGLCDDLWRKIFAKSRALARWDARVAAMDALLSESLAKWTPCYFANDTPIEAEMYIEFACSFKLLELTRLRDEEDTDVSIYVFDYSTRSYVYTDEDTEFLFGVEEEEEEEHVAVE
jgi:hypothetical protein